MLTELESLGIKIDRPDLENEELEEILYAVAKEKDDILKFGDPADYPPPFPYEDEKEEIVVNPIAKEIASKNILFDEDLLINRHIGVEEEISEFSKVGDKCKVYNIFRNINELIGEEREYFAGFFFKMGMRYGGFNLHYFSELETYCVYVGDIEEAEKLTVELLEEHFK